MLEIEHVINSGPLSMSNANKVVIHTVDEDCLLSQFVAFVNAYDQVNQKQIMISIGSNDDCDNLVPPTNLNLFEVQDFRVLAPDVRRKYVAGGDNIYLKVHNPITSGQMDITIFAHGFKI